MLRQRGPNKPSPAKDSTSYPPVVDTLDDPLRPLLGSAKEVDAPSLTRRPPSTSQSPSYNSAPREEDPEMDLQNMSRKSQWIILAVASGACAAFNGVFAKLTTTELTTSFATGIANLLGLSNIEKGVEVVVRGIFFGLNLIFNGIMWALFTKALARGTSTTQVSILNTSANFMITALLGLIIFSESLPPLWFLGAALLVAGNVIIGRRDEGEDKAVEGGEDGEARVGQGQYGDTEGEERGGLLVGESVELAEDLETKEAERKRKQDEEDILHLGSDTEEEDDQRARLI